MSREDVNSLMKNLSEAYADSEIKEDKYLSKLILRSAQVLEETKDINMIANTLCVFILNYNFAINGAKNKIPQAANDLYHKCSHIKGYYNVSRGNAYFRDLRII